MLADLLMTTGARARTAGVHYTLGNVGGIAGMWCRPDGAPLDAAILDLHGGAYALGSAKAYRHFVGQIVVRCGVATFVADYRLAPENVFPAAMDDALAASWRKAQRVLRLSATQPVEVFRCPFSFEQRHD